MVDKNLDLSSCCTHKTIGCGMVLWRVWVQSAELFLFSVQILIFQSCQYFILNHAIPLGMYTDFCQVVLLSVSVILGGFLQHCTRLYHEDVSAKASLRNEGSLHSVPLKSWIYSKSYGVDRDESKEL